LTNASKKLETFDDILIDNDTIFKTLFFTNENKKLPPM
jgi:hypothetical protein